jgi:hypothetical protein
MGSAAFVEAAHPILMQLRMGLASRVPPRTKPGTWLITSSTTWMKPVGSCEPGMLHR